MEITAAFSKAVGKNFVENKNEEDDPIWSKRNCCLMAKRNGSWVKRRHLFWSTLSKTGRTRTSIRRGVVPPPRQPLRRNRPSRPSRPSRPQTSSRLRPADPGVRRPLPRTKTKLDLNLFLSCSVSRISIHRNFLIIYASLIIVQTIVCGVFFGHKTINESSPHLKKKDDPEAVFLVMCDPSMNDLWVR